MIYPCCDGVDGVVFERLNFSMLCGCMPGLEILFEFAMIYPCLINFVTVRECVCVHVWTGDDVPFPHGIDGCLRAHRLLCLRVVESVGLLLFLVDCVSKCAVGGRR